MLENYINGWNNRPVGSERTSVEWRNKDACMTNTNGNPNYAQLNLKGGHNTWIDPLGSKCDVQIYIQNYALI